MVLHEKNILHRDLKSANIFIQNDKIYKIGDFNVSKISKLGLIHLNLRIFTNINWNAILFIS